MNDNTRPPPRAIGKDPYLSYRFRAEIESLEVVGFSEVSGVSAETELLSFREGGVNGHEWQLAGPSKFPSRLVLKRGLADSEELWNWYVNVMEGRIRLRKSSRPPAGNTCHLTAKMSINIIPSQNPGMACPNNANDLATRSVPVPLFVADRTPRGTPTNIAKTYAPIAS